MYVNRTTRVIAGIIIAIAFTLTLLHLLGVSWLQ
jgi:hypothetical protein